MTFVQKETTRTPENKQWHVNPTKNVNKSFHSDAVNLKGRRKKRREGRRKKEPSTKPECLMTISANTGRHDSFRKPPNVLRKNECERPRIKPESTRNVSNVFSPEEHDSTLEVDKRVNQHRGNRQNKMQVWCHVNSNPSLDLFSDSLQLLCPQRELSSSCRPSWQPRVENEHPRMLPHNASKTEDRKERNPKPHQNAAL